MPALTMRAQDSPVPSAQAGRRMDRSIEVATGESVAFSYELAGLGSRFLAVFIDTALQLLVAFAVVAIVLVAGGSLPGGADLKPSPNMKLAQALLLAAVLFAAFVLFFGYFIAFEALWDGRTPGKRIVGIRVVRDGGFPLDFTSALIRNVVRILEASLGFYAISAVCALLSAQNRRLGDFAAGTVVVRDRFDDASLSSLLPTAQIESDDPLVRELGSRERELVRRYAARRELLGDGSRRALAAQISDVVRPHLAARFDHLDDDALLVHVAAALG